MQFIIPSLSLATILLSCSTVLAAPASAHPAKKSSAVHACSVFVQRWIDNSFDAGYYRTAPTSPGVWPVGSFFFTQESEVANSAQAGQQLVPIKAGSNILQITNVVNPTTYYDAGKLSFVWGSETFDSLSSACSVVPVGANWVHGDATTYTCTYQCDA